jgi:hypothetical protein
MNKTLSEMDRCLSFETPVPLYLWPETISTTAYLINRRPASKLRHCTPEELFTKKKPDLCHLRIFGSTTYVLIPFQKHGKMAPKSQKAIMVGYDQTSKGYRCYVPSLKKIIISRDVQFNEGDYQSIIWTEQTPTPISEFRLPISGIDLPTTLPLLSAACRPDTSMVSPPPLTPIPTIVTPRPHTPSSPTILLDRGGTAMSDTSPRQPISPPLISPSCSLPLENVAMALPQDTVPTQEYTRREKPQPRRSFCIRRPFVHLQDIDSIHEVTHSPYHVDSYFIGSIEDNLTFTQASQQPQWISAIQEEM